VVFCRTVMLPVPTSPAVVNLTPSLVAEMTTAWGGGGEGWKGRRVRGKGGVEVAGAGGLHG
jgi:hypothetical protein